MGKKSRKKKTEKDEVKAPAKKRFRVPAIAAVCVAGLAAAVVGGCSLIYIFTPSLPVEIPENVTLIYDSEGNEFARLRRYGRDEAYGLSEKTALSFVKNSAFTDIISGTLGAAGITEMCASELLARELPGVDEGISVVSAAKYIDSLFDSAGGLAMYYCRSACFGAGIYGLDRAAAFYYSKTADALDNSELDVLRTISRSDDLKNMTGAQIKAAPRFSGAGFSGDPFPVTEESVYITSLVREAEKRLTESGMTPAQAGELLYNGNAAVYSCLDREMQEAVDDVITLKKVNVDFQIAMTICNDKGGICAATGGIGPHTITDRSLTPHPIGSAVKPLSVYAPALEKGIITYSSLLPDEPYVAENGWPNNFDGSHDGEVTTAKALRRSKNTTAVYLADILGFDKCMEQLAELGFTYIAGEQPTPSNTALGYFTNGVSTEQLAAAYNVFSNGGTYYEPYYAVKIVDNSGNVLYEKGEPAGKRIFSPQTSYIMNRLMMSNIELPDGLGIRAHIDGTEAAGKTGTTDNRSGISTSHVFACCVPGYVGAVWVGSDDTERAMDFSEGVADCTMVWHSVFSRFAKPSVFDVPEGVVSADFCRDTGLLASPGCKDTEKGWYTEDSLPEICSLHK